MCVNLNQSVVLNSLYHIAERINKHHIENFNQLNRQVRKLHT